MCIEPPSLQNPLTKKHDINPIKNILEDKSLTIVIKIISIKNVETNNKSKKIYENWQRLLVLIRPNDLWYNLKVRWIVSFLNFKVFLSKIGLIYLKMNEEEAKALLKGRGVSVINMPRGYIVKVSRREGSPSRRIEMDEIDAILTLGRITLLAVEDSVGDILIECSKSVK